MHIHIELHGSTRKINREVIEREYLLYEWKKKGRKEDTVTK
jgi:hypothetical protein